MNPINLEKIDTVAIIKMENQANKWNLDFVTQMNRMLETILEDPDIFSVIITSTDPKNFSQGIDIEWLGGKLNEKDIETIKTFMYEANTLFKKCLTLPLPVIAAINGHAFGNGAMLACACDFRFMNSEKGFFCFPEVDISIPFLPGMIEFVRKAIPEYKFNEMKLTGKRVTAKELEACHAIEKASENAVSLMEDALDFARTFKKQRPIFGEHKKRMYKHILQVIDTEDPEYIEPLNLFV